MQEIDAAITGEIGGPALGVGSEFRAPMGVAVIGGVISSTVLTLVVVPVGFVWMERVRGWFRPALKPSAVVPAADDLDLD